MVSEPIDTFFFFLYMLVSVGDQKAHLWSSEVSVLVFLGLTEVTEADFLRIV